MRIKLIYLSSLYIFWLAISGLKFTIISTISFVLMPLIALLFAKKLSLIPASNDINFYKTSKYLLWLLKEIVVSSIEVSKIAWRRNLGIYPLVQPIISAQASSLGIVAYANSITLTPGTVTLRTEGNALLVHALDTSFMEGLHTGVMDAKVTSIFD